ncbi:MAG: hypothetical protein Q8O03_02810 [Nanoarchaeota archaeon]|nr:hypothetical protein [Nanoarchaeota archaeon]
MSYHFAPQKKFMDLEGILKKYSVCEEDFLKTLKNLKEKLGYAVRVRPDMFDEQAERIARLAVEGDKVLGVIGTLAETGYCLDTLEDYKILLGSDCRVIKYLAVNGVERYLDTFNNVKKILGYKGKVKYFADAAEAVFELSTMEGDALGALDSLIKTGYNKVRLSEKYNLGMPPIHLIRKLAKEDNKKYLEVFAKLKEKLGYKTIYGDADNQVNAIIRLSKINNICRVIEVIGESGYYLSYLSERKLDCWDVARIEDIAELGAEKYLYRSYYPLKDILKISRTNSSIVSNIIKLSRMGDDAFKVIDALAKTGYELETVAGFKWFDIHDVELVNKLMGEGLERYLEALDKTKDALGYGAYGQKTYGQNYHAIRNGSKIKYLAEHANDILRVLEIKGDVWQALDALVKSGYKVGFSKEKLFGKISLVEWLARCDVKKYSDVFNKLKEKFNYKTVDIGDECDNQVERLIELSGVRGDVCKAIDALAESGYKLATLGNKAWMCYHDRDAIREASMSGPENYLKVFKKLKEKLDYKTVRVKSEILNGQSYNQVQKIIEISQIAGNVCKAIDILRDYKRLGFGIFKEYNFKEYKIDRKKGITDEDVGRIRYISDMLWKDSLKDFTSCFYKDSANLFIECFESLSVEEKKVVLKGIFNCNKIVNKEIIGWLDKNEPELVREVGIGLI